MKKINWIIGISVILLGFMNCTPKTIPQTTETPPPPPVVDENLSPCPKFRDAKYPDEVENNYVIYRDFLKNGKIDQAFELWQKVYEEAPAADGKRSTVFEDGIYFYKRIYAGETDSLRKMELLNSIMSFFDEMANCYGEPEMIGARKAFEYYYTFPGTASNSEIYTLFKNYIDKAGLKTQAFAINPFTALLLERGLANEISLEEAKIYERKIKEIITHNLSTAKGQDLEAWKIVDSYAPERLSDFETLKNFYDCSYYMNKYYPIYEENPADCDIIRETYSWLKWGGCLESDPKFQSLIKTGNEKCATGSSSGPASEAYNCLKNADYRCAVEKFEQAANEATEVEKKATYTLLIAKIYYSHLKNFSRSRQYALDAARIRPNWGEPYMLIGRLYASSGPLCGPGRGWDSQVVTWVAIDMWSRAKSVDSSVASEANKLIGRYTQYMPSVEDIFQRGLKEGESYYVGCWIQQSTTVRAVR